jgi:hypothetical protein
VGDDNFNLRKEPQDRQDEWLAIPVFKHQTVKKYGGAEMKYYTFLTLALIGGGW